MKVTWPTNGSDMILNASAANGSSSRACAQYHLRSSGVRAFDRRNIERRRQEIHNRVQQRLNALILKGRTCQHGHQLQRNRRAAKRNPQFFFCNRLFIQILVDQRRRRARQCIRQLYRDDLCKYASSIAEAFSAATTSGRLARNALSQSFSTSNTSNSRPAFLQAR